MTELQHSTSPAISFKPMLPACANSRPKLLDLYCGAGGAGWGYYLSGYDVTGVDNEEQPYLPKEIKFIKANALDILNDIDFCRQFDVIHASPVCKGYSTLKAITGKKYPNDIPIVREKLKVIGKPYIIENVPGAPLRNYVILCGSMFGLGVIRHRLFECCPEIYFPPAACNCHGGTASHRGISSHANGAKFICVAGNNYKAEEGRKAMGIDWMPMKYLSQAIPPAYTQWLGSQMMERLSLHCR